MTVLRTAIVVAFSLAVAACSPTSVRYRLDLREPRNQECFRACQSASNSTRCLKACPGIERDEDEPCRPEDAPPRAACRVEESGAASSGTTVVAVVALGLLLVLGFGFWQVKSIGAR